MLGHFHVRVPPQSLNVFLLNLCQPGEHTDDLFVVSQPAEATRVMKVLDPINGRRGDAREMMSQGYTARLDQLWSVACK